MAARSGVDKLGSKGFAPMTKSNSVKRPAGFSLVELLVVCAIIALIVGFTIPAATTIIRGSQLTQGSQLLTDQLSLARQQALSKNRAVEVRFYKFADPETPGEDKAKPDTGRYRAFQAFEVLESGAAVPLNKVQRLPASVVINEGALSSLISDATKAGKDGTTATKPSDEKIKTSPEIPGVGFDYVYVSFRYLQDGSTDLPLIDTTTGGSGGATGTTKNWFLTLNGIELPAKLDKPETGSDKKKINFFTLQVDPVSGATKPYRPMAG